MYISELVFPFPDKFSSCKTCFVSIGSYQPSKMSFCSNFCLEEMMLIPRLHSYSLELEGKSPFLACKGNSVCKSNTHAEDLQSWL